MDSRANRPSASFGHEMRDVIAAIHERDWRRAETLCAQLLKQHGDHAAVLQMIGWMRLEQGDAVAARAALAEALARRPAHAPTLLLAARAAQATGALEQAIAHAGAAAALNPHDPEPAWLAATLEHERGDLASADRGLQAVLHRHPTHAASWYEWGRVRRALAGTTPMARNAPALAPLADARRAFEQAIALSPTLVPAWFALALCAQDAGDLDAAAAALEQVLALAATNAEAALNLGLVRQSQGRLDDAMRCYAQALRSKPESFGRIVHALASERCGVVWLDADALRNALDEAAARTPVEAVVKRA